MATPNTIIGSREGIWQKLGRVTAANIVDVTAGKESVIDTATAGSLIKYQVERGMMALMLRCRIDQQSGSAAFTLKVAKGEKVEAITDDPAVTAFEKFYDDLGVAVTFTTSAGAIAAERGGYYADGFSVTTDSSLKGIGSANGTAKVTYVDFLGFPYHAAILTAITGAWAELDITNS